MQRWFCTTCWLSFGEEEQEDWIDFDDFSDMDDWARAPYEEDDELNLPIPENAPKYTRRLQLLHYFKEFFWI